MEKNIEQRSINTSRLSISYLTAGNPANKPVVLVHGNVSSNLFWDDSIAELAKNYFVLAPDLRGYGDTEAVPIDATRGVRDWSDDLKSFVDALKLEQPALVGWSLGGGVVMQYAIDYSNYLSSLILINPISPYGFGGTKDEKGTPCYNSFAGSGGGTANTEFIEQLKNKDMSELNSNSPRNVMNQFYLKPPFKVAEKREDIFVQSMLSTRIGDGFYPGTYDVSNDWPGVVPGKVGINNAMSPKYLNLEPIAEIEPKIPILWVRGANDLIVSDQSFFDFGYLGKLGYIPGWPGEDVYPAQPMVSQTRYVLDRYKENGGAYEEFVIDDSGHSPHIEKPEIFIEKVNQFLRKL